MRAEQFNSCIYSAKVMHHRLEPKRHRFVYDMFMFYLDLDELDGIAKKMTWFSRNRFNLFNFRDRDHLQLPGGQGGTFGPVREQIKNYLLANGVDLKAGRIMLLTNLCTLGYQFNPVSFYFCYDESGEPLCSVVEVCNTFREMKPYFVGNECKTGNRFQLRTAKEFYVSPFMALDSKFDFTLQLPGEQLQIHIKDYDTEGKLLFLSTLTGRRKQLTDLNLIKSFVSIPMITLKVIVLIHWQAFLLWTKKLSYIKKADNPHLQKGVFRPYRRARLG